jgi:hypothetical protein
LNEPPYQKTNTQSIHNPNLYKTKPYWHQNAILGSDGVAQVVEHLTSKDEALNLKKKKKNSHTRNVHCHPAWMNSCCWLFVRYNYELYKHPFIYHILEIKPRSWSVLMVTLLLKKPWQGKVKCPAHDHILLVNIGAITLIYVVPTHDTVTPLSSLVRR